MSGRNTCFICTLMGSVQGFCLKAFSNIICVPSFFQQKPHPNLISLFIIITSTWPLCHISGAPTAIAPWEDRGGARPPTSPAAPWQHWHAGEGRQELQKKRSIRRSKDHDSSTNSGFASKKGSRWLGREEGLFCKLDFNLDWLIQYTRVLQGLDTCWVHDLTFSLTMSLAETYTQGCSCFQCQNSFFCLLGLWKIKHNTSESII